MSATAAELAAALDASRARFLAILEPFDETVLRRQHDILMSPLLWDLAHVANYEDIWLVRALGGEPTRAGLDDLYDAFKQPRNVREALPLLDLGGARAYGDAVRARALERLDEADLSPDAATRLTREGFVHRMVAQHEHQHAETLLAAIQLLPPEEGHVLAASETPLAQVAPLAEVFVPGGAFRMGSAEVGALDNERPVHEVDVPPFWIDAAPVTNGQHRRFVEDGGYDEPRWWTDTGWKWRQEAGLVAPQFWRPDGGGWTRLQFGRVEPLPRRRARAARRLARSRRLCTVGRPAAPHGGGVGEGGRVRARHRPTAAGGRGATRLRPSDTPTSASATSAPRRSARTQRA